MHALRNFWPCARRERDVAACEKTLQKALITASPTLWRGWQRDVVHRRCGCIAGELVENIFKCLMVLMRTRVANFLVTRMQGCARKKRLRYRWNSACSASMPTPTLRWRSDVFHSRCGCLPGEPVENTFKSLMALTCTRAAKLLVTPPSRDRTFSTALVDALCTSLWTNRIVPFADKYLARGDGFFASTRLSCVFHSFCGCALGKAVDKRDRGLCRQ